MRQISEEMCATRSLSICRMRLLKGHGRVTPHSLAVQADSPRVTPLITDDGEAGRLRQTEESQLATTLCKVYPGLLVRFKPLSFFRVLLLTSTCQLARMRAYFPLIRDGGDEERFPALSASARFSFLVCCFGHCP